MTAPTNPFTNIASAAGLDHLSQNKPGENKPGQNRPSQRAAQPIRLLVLDVDGVLTDGGIFVDDRGAETKRYHVMDGFGLRLWAKLGERHGLHTAVITGRTSATVLERLADLNIPHVIQGSKDKLASLDGLLKSLGLSRAQACMVADDWPDLTVMRSVGYAIAVNNAHDVVKAAAHYTTARSGGSGAVREAIEHLLELRGLTAEALALYDSSKPSGVPAHA